MTTARCRKVAEAKPFQSNNEYLEEYTALLEALCRLRNGGQDEDEDSTPYRSRRKAYVASPPDPIRQKQYGKMEKAFRKRTEATIEKGEVKLPLASISMRYGLSDFEERILFASLLYPTSTSFARLMDDTTGCGCFNIRALLRLFCASKDEQTAARRVFTPRAPLSRNGLLDTGCRRSWKTMSEEDFLSLRPELPFRISTMILGEGFFDSASDGSQRLIIPETTLDDIDLPEETKALIRRVVDFEKNRKSVIDANAGEESCDPHLILLYGPSATTSLKTAGAIAGMLGRKLLRIMTNRFLSREFDEPDDLVRTLGMARLDNAIPCFTRAEGLFDEDCYEHIAEVFSEELSAFNDTVILTITGQPCYTSLLGSLVSYPVEIPTPSTGNSSSFIRGLIPEGTPISPDLDFDLLAERLRFTGTALERAVRAACARARLRSENDGELKMEDFIQASDNDELQDIRAKATTYRTRARARLADVVLPEPLLADVRSIISAVSAKGTVFDEWGFGESYRTGRSISALFYGPSGTGKTLTAEAIAGELGKPLRVVQISGLMDKYVGETEKHIVEVFRSAASAGEVLLFDEADAMFAARVDGSTHNSYYINSHTNTLLHEMDVFGGIVLLSSNREFAMDKAFERRIRWKLEFPQPDASVRERIWRKLLPGKAPLAEDIDLAALAREFDFSGGLIRSTILKAAFEAASMGTRITQELLRNAARNERIVNPEAKGGIGFGATA